MEISGDFNFIFVCETDDVPLEKLILTLIDFLG
jgi:hypothetical protein